MVGNGPGIDAKYFDKIFQLLQALDPRDKVKGTGVGLALVKKILEAEDGEIWLESRQMPRRYLRRDGRDA